MTPPADRGLLNAPCGIEATRSISVDSPSVYSPAIRVHRNNEEETQRSTLMSPHLFADTLGLGRDRSWTCNSFESHRRIVGILEPVESPQATCSNSSGQLVTIGA